MVHDVHAPQKTGAFDTRRAHELPDADPAKSWLIESVWGFEALGVLGALPKRCKTHLACDIMISVASGTPCLGHFAVHRTGTVLAYVAEGTATELKGRLVGICVSRRISLDKLNVHITDDPEDPLDLGNAFHLHRLEMTIKKHEPVLLVLDPFVRMFHGNEDDSSQVSKVFRHLDRLKRRLHLAIMIVHHNSKRHEGGGHALRGSGDFHAISDSAIYLSGRKDGAISIAVQHRFARSPEPFAMRLSADEPIHLQLVDADDDHEQTVEPRDLESQVLEHLSKKSEPQRRDDIRNDLGVNSKALLDALKRLEAAGTVIYLKRKWSLATNGELETSQEIAD